MGTMWTRDELKSQRARRWVVEPNVETYGIGWAVGWGGTIVHTTDGGSNWSSQPSGTSNTLYDLAFTNASTGWVVGGMGTIVHTTNGGY